MIMNISLFGLPRKWFLKKMDLSLKYDGYKGSICSLYVDDFQPLVFYKNLPARFVYEQESLLANKLIVRRGDVFAHGTKRFLRHDFDGGAGRAVGTGRKNLKFPDRILIFM